MAGRNGKKGKLIISLDNPERKAYNGTPEKLQLFLENYAACGQLIKACEASGIAWNQHYRWLQADPKYREAFEEVQQVTGQRLEDVAMKLALAGEIPVLLPMLRRFKPEYRERLEQNLNISIEVPERLEAARARARALTQVIDINADTNEEDLG